MRLNINDAIVAAGSKYLDTDYFTSGMPVGSTYTRTGVATARTVSGTIENFAADVPQRTDRGLVLEAANTNSILRSQEFESSSWGKANVTVVANDALAPDGATTADRIQATATGIAIINQPVTGSGLAGGNTAIIFAKKGSGANDANNFIFRNDTTSTNLVSLSINYDTGVLSGSPGGATATALTDGWWMLVMPAPSGISAGNQLRLYSCFGGSSETAGEFAYVWGANILGGVVASSPIPTTTTAVTRGLPVFTEPVPLGRTKALLTYADGSTTLVTDLTPGGVFDVATAVINAGKGQFSASELVTRVWQA